MGRPTVVVILTAVLLAACGGEDPISPLPVQAAPSSSAPPSPPARPPASSAAPTSSSPTRASPTSSSPVVVRPKRTTTTRPATTKPAPPSACLGAVRYDLDLQDTELELIRSMCFQAGGVLRLQGIGPGLVTATPEDLVSQHYEGGVVDLRFVEEGTVTVTIPQQARTHTIRVVVIR